MRDQAFLHEVFPPMNALPSPKPNRRKRLALRFAVIVAAVSALGAAYLVTRPDEFEWWTSPGIGNTGHHARVLIPQGWEVALYDTGQDPDGSWLSYYKILNLDQRPRFLRWILLQDREDADLGILLEETRNGQPLRGKRNVGLRRIDVPGHRRYAMRSVTFRDTRIRANVLYRRTNLTSFNRTYRQICNSLRIE
jgi:hypothetical protein